MKNFDVIIIGAGPAGSMAAKEIASKGYSVSIIELKKEIGNPVQCAEAITEFALENVGLKVENKWLKQRLKGVKILLHNNKCFYSTVPSLSISRRLFDQWLADNAIEAGSHLFLRSKMKDIKGKEGSWKIITKNETYSSKIIIGADGASSKTARILGLLKKREYIKAFQYKFNKNDINFNESEWLCMTMDEVFKGGYGWVFPRGDEYNVGIGGPQGNIKLLNDYCKSQNFDINKKKKLNAGLVPYNFDFSSRSRNGALIIGDAGGLTNPVTGGGIHSAMFSGKKAAELVNNALEQENYSIVKKYDSIIEKTMFLHPIHRKTAGYFKKWTNKDWGFFGNAANGLDMKDLTLLKSFIIGLKYPKYLLRSMELLTIRKEMQINQKYGF
jgi:digeranylgeranylglycerophospholipid reductase